MATEKRLIDANALKSEFEWLKSVVNESSKDEIQETIQRIENAPTVDAVEVVHGQWKPDLHPYYEQPYRDEWYGYMFKCSVCGATTIGDCDLLCRAKYCPNCGAKMDGDVNG